MIRMGRCVLFTSLEEAVQFLRHAPPGGSLYFDKLATVYKWGLIYGLK